jgi:inner membrane protein
VVLLVLVVAFLTGKAEFSKVMARDNSIVRTCFGIAMMFLICWFGRKQPHRTFMHSVLGVVLLSVASYLVFTEIWLYMALGMVSHIALDLLNKKRITLLYPLKKPKFALGICTADSAVNTVLFYAFSVLCVLEMVVAIYRIVL